MPPPANLSDLSRAELEARFVELLGEVLELKQIVAAQRDEIARLKGLKGRPSIKPSGMEDATGPKRGGKRVKRRRRGKVTPRVMPETEVLRVAHPTGSQFKGYEPSQVQELVLTARLPSRALVDARWRDDRRAAAQRDPWPFWPRATPLRIDAVSPGSGDGRASGCAASGNRHQHLQASAHAPTDRQTGRFPDGDPRGAARRTGNGRLDHGGRHRRARHRGVNGVCTQIGNDNFAWFGTTGSKSRLNFLDLLRAGHTDYTINDAALEYMREHAMAGTLVQRLATHKRRQFADEKAWTRHLKHLGIADLAVTPDPVRVATEGALWGAVNAHGLLCEAVVVSDDAGQFNVGQHALCWVHAERLGHKLETFTDQQRVSPSSTSAG
jgi:hypothetical protein